MSETISGRGGHSLYVSVCSRPVPVCRGRREMPLPHQQTTVQSPFLFFHRALRPLLFLICLCLQNISRHLSGDLMPYQYSSHLPLYSERPLPVLLRRTGAA